MRKVMVCAAVVFLGGVTLLTFWLWPGPANIPGLRDLRPIREMVLISIDGRDINDRKEKPVPVTREQFHGYPVLGSDGGPIQIDRQLPFTVTPRGEILQAGDVRTLAVREPQSLGDLVREGENLFRPIGTPPSSVPDAQRQVYWKHLEMSAVQPHREMIEMIATSRAYEANVRMMQNHDGMLGSLIGKLLKA